MPGQLAAFADGEIAIYCDDADDCDNGARPSVASQHLLHGHSNVPGNLAKQYRRDVSAGMKRHRRASTVGMATLFMRAALANTLIC